MYGDGYLQPNSRPAQTMKGAIDGAAWNAARALHMLDELDGTQKQSRMASEAHHRISPVRVSAGPNTEIPLHELAPASTPAGTPANRDAGTTPLSAGTPLPAASPAVVKGSDVILLDSRVVGTLCAKIKCKVPPSITQYCGGLAIGKMVSRAGDVAVVDFGSDIFTVPYYALTSVQHIGSVRRKAVPPPRDTKDAQLAQLVRSLKYKADALRRKDDELASSKKEVFLLKRQLDKAGMASWVHAQVLEERVLFLPRGDTGVPVGTDITHHLDDEATGGDNEDKVRRAPSVEGKEIVLGTERYCSLVVSGHKMFAHNATDDMQIDFCLKLGQDGVQGSHRVLWSPNAPRTFTVRVFPGETLPLVELNDAWDERYSISYSFGPVEDTRFLDSLRQLRGEAVTNDTNLVTSLATEHNVDYSRVSAQEHIIELCVEHNARYVDLQFPPSADSLFEGSGSHEAPVSWMRPQDFLISPALFKSDPSSANVVLGSLGDCAFIDSVMVLIDAGRVNNGYLLKRLLAPPLADAAVANEQKLGIYRVSMCLNGWWNWHVVDSYLPMQNGLHTKLAYASTKDRNELWLAILQKAYAKTHGRYQDLIHGNVNHILEDLSGYPTEVLDWQDANVFDVMHYHHREGHPLLLTSTSMDVTTTAEEADKFKQSGIVPGRVYPVLDMKYFEAKDLSLLKVKNMCGDSIVWDGDWANDSDAWNDAPEVAQECQRSDDSIWMSFQESQAYFDNVGALLVTHNWWDLRFKTGFYDSRPRHAFAFTVYKDTEALVSVVQADHEKRLKTYAALRVEVVEKVGRGRWETVVESNERFIRGRGMHTSFFNFRAGCEYAVLLHQWAKEDNAYCRNKQDVVLRVATQQRNFGVLKITEMIRDMTECLHYEGYPGFDPNTGKTVTLEAQEDAVECDSSQIMPSNVSGVPSAPPSAPAASPVSMLGSDDDDGVSIVSHETEVRADPIATASRLRMHIGTVLQQLHPDDRELLCGIADNLERGEGAMQTFVNNLYNPSDSRPSRQSLL
eukprot:TRINITY_DN16428_c0_g1_i1.p1 TRINITY_DN16428_c0_g1~~TRINITY_DN16428_c0_g1_i1.p1  ORF type:complete len:1030 (+),score=325.77 TRINITY_DN16428_c0_g1_i1:37-3090(+)